MGRGKRFLRPVRVSYVIRLPHTVNRNEWNEEGRQWSFN